MATESLQDLSHGFPFPAIVGQEKVKKALLCLMASPEVNSVLITGGAGTAKSTAVRSLRSILPGLRIINVPPNVGEDRLLGGMDMEHAIRHGNKRFLPGILKEADDALIYLDEINLFDENIVHRILDASERRFNHVEREGVTGQHECRFKLVGTMDPEEGGLSPHLLDRFDICISMDDITVKEDRLEVLRRRLMHEKDPGSLREKHGDEMRQLGSTIGRSLENAEFMVFPDAFYDSVSRLCIDLNVQGHRGDMSTVRTAKALAALNGRHQVSLEDLQEAATLCLQHRRHDPEEDKPKGGRNEDAQDDRTEPMENDSVPEMPEGIPPHSDDLDGRKGDREEVFSMGDPFIVIDYLRPDESMAGLGKRKGKRGSATRSDSFGRCKSFRVPTGPVNGLALVPTLRAAAPHQRSRCRNDLAIALEPSDFREKVRVGKKGTTILFLVDASGSMGARRRMVTVKGAILSLLKDAYQKRDSVGLMSFRKESAELLLPPTKSTDLAFHKLRQMPTGGKTPLAHALSQAGKLLSSERMRDEEDLVLVIVSDGRANVSKDGQDAFQEALAVAERMSSLSVRYVVVDSGPAFPRIDRAERLCQALKGTYYRLEDLNADRLAHSLRLAVHGAS